MKFLVFLVIVAFVLQGSAAVQDPASIISEPAGQGFAPTNDPFQKVVCGLLAVSKVYQPDKNVDLVEELGKKFCCSCAY